MFAVSNTSCSNCLLGKWNVQQKKNAENKMLTLFEKSITKIQKFQLFKIDDKTDQKRRIIGDISELKAYFHGSKQLYAAQFKQNNGLDVPFFLFYRAKQ